MIEQRIPELSDQELERLHTNAVRLAQSGTPIQREQAEKLLPQLGVAMEERKAARLALQSETRRTAVRKRALSAAALKEKSEQQDG